MTELVLRGGNLGDCPPVAGQATAISSLARAAAKRRLWGQGKGRFRTRGSHGIATVRGTHWSTEDRCDRTVVTVRSGVVEVRDIARRRTVTVRAGDWYTARAKKR